MSSEQRSICLLGGTGSVGKSTLDVIRSLPEKFRLKSVSAHRNSEQLAAIVEEFNPDNAVLSGDNGPCEALLSAAATTGCSLAMGPAALSDIAAEETDLVVAALVGAAGLEPAMAALKAGTNLALANKECLVCAGDLMISAAEESGAAILPIDSEHNAIFQVFEAEKADTVTAIHLTASGGPFRSRPIDTLPSVTVQEAVSHPNWDMGAKISVDSATMMNKGLELIEAYYLFPVEKDQIKVIIHPQSVIHSMVEYCDGSWLAQMGTPDMRTPVAYCLAYPERVPVAVDKLSLSEISTLTFEAPDMRRFPALALAQNALLEGGAMPLVLNAANEIAVAAFLEGSIAFTDIAPIVEETLVKSDIKAPQSLANVLEADKVARRLAMNNARMTRYAS